ncbi:hypothetical protein BJV78DRAFT_1235959 [Lactifluus subvellereus]|nr:hypothetical protein BJV78DRAFT_1235959 [Lactifluus subvellereus]
MRSGILNLGSIWSHGLPQPQFRVHNPPLYSIYVHLPGGASAETQPVVCLTWAFVHTTTSCIYFCQVAMEPRPCSPETAAFVTSSIDSWNKFFSENNQSDSDSIQQSPTPSENYDHFSEDVLNDTIDSVPLVPSVPPQLYGVYEGLTSFLGCSYDELLDLDVSSLESIVDEINTLLRDTITTGYSRHWADFGCWLDIGHSLARVLMVKKAAAARREEEYDADVDSEELSGSDYEEERYVVSTEHWEDSGIVDEEWIRDMYTRGWDNLVEWPGDDVEYLGY